MSAIRMEYDPDITVLIDPWKDETREEIAKGVYLTRNYINPSGILPKENFFLNNNEQWFYWLGYNKEWESKISENEKGMIEKVRSYINNNR